MSLSIKDLPVGTLALTSDGKFAVVVEHKLQNPKNPIIFKMNSKTSYKGSPGDFDSVLGTADVNVLKAFKVESLPPPVNDFDFPLVLKSRGVEVGDKIKLTNGSIVEFAGYKSSRPKYPLQYKYNGKSYKASLAMFAEKA